MSERAWETVRKGPSKIVTVLGLVALWLGAFFSFGAAYYSKRTADRIAAMEIERINYEKNKYTSDLMYRWGDFIQQMGPILPCVDALLKLNDTDFRGLLNHPTAFEFSFQNPTHKGALECLPVGEKQSLLKNQREWTNDDSYAIRHRIVSEVNQLDSLLTSFNY